ncbi:hypothetical protein VRU48_19155 [Pedobacter sp. KR3-3]|uniref:Uncharacterized protein n=1 Tax=Pedobacter albus TaxID=3113905 RepID=A0ABU7ICN5_9SPHI|nr:hypothetical protein [Pedobacter sp. KR3-3]MEE1947253.1 hypothetical protein [Pedobacter sp. KR3-3]
MDNTKTEALITYLATAGFTGAKLEADLHNQIELMAPTFRITHRLPFDGELMSYELGFTMDHQFQAYRLESYKATHRNVIDIDYTTLAGIDTAALEERMKLYDWDAYFDAKITDPDFRDAIQEIITDLDKIARDAYLDGSNIRDLLVFKYWPEKMLHPNVHNELSVAFERSLEFRPSKTGITSAGEAFVLTSGRLETLFEKLNRLNLEDRFPEVDLYPQLLKSMAKGTSFGLAFRSGNPEGYIELSVPVSKTGNDFNAAHYLVAYTSYPAIEHGTFNGIDTALLEEKMGRVDWDSEFQRVTMEGEGDVVIPPATEEIMLALDQLKSDPAGIKIMDQLQLKYWSEADYFDLFVRQEAWDYLETLPKKEQRFPVELEATMGINLLTGKAVAKDYIIKGLGLKESGDWLRLDLTAATKNDDPSYISAGKFARQEIEEQLYMLPLSMRVGQVQQLMKGNRITERLMGGRMIRIDTLPEQRTLQLYTEGNRPIAFNFSLDPDWTPVLHDQQYSLTDQTLRPKTLPANKQNRHRGKKRGRGI